MGISVINKKEKIQSKVPGKLHHKLKVILSLIVGAQLFLLSQVAGALTGDITYGEIIEANEGRFPTNNQIQENNSINAKIGSFGKGYEVEAQVPYNGTINTDQGVRTGVVPGSGKGGVKIWETKYDLDTIQEKCKKYQEMIDDELELTEEEQLFFDKNCFKEFYPDLQTEANADETPTLVPQEKPGLEAYVEADDPQVLEAEKTPTAIINDYVEGLDREEAPTDLIGDYVVDPTAGNSLSGSGRISCALHTVANQTGMGWFYLMMLALPGMFPYLKQRFRKGN